MSAGAIHAWLTELERRITNRSDSTSVLVLVECTLPFLMLLMGMQLYAAQDKDLAPLYSTRWLWPTLWAQIALIVWLTVIGGIALRLKGDRRPMDCLVQLTVFPAGLGVLALSLAFGLKDTPMCTVVMAEFVFLRSLFPSRKVKYAMGAALAMVLCNELAVHLQWIGYAPLLAKSIYAEGSMNWWWTLWTRTLYLCAAYPVTGWFLFLAGTMHRNRLRLKQFASTDPLTGLANRHAFMRRMEQAAMQHNGPDTPPLSIAMLDVDHFKHVNDTYGHQAGDAVLARLGQILREQTREGVDTAARLGGEEFALMLPGMDATQARDVAERISAALRQARFEMEGRAFSVTQSVGIAQVKSGQVFAALKEADEHLYRAKETGRNRVLGAAEETRGMSLT